MLVELGVKTSQEVFLGTTTHEARRIATRGRAGASDGVRMRDRPNLDIYRVALAGNDNFIKSLWCTWRS
eukprot:4650476-Pleurochrysis_carterae.AAC.1